MELYDSIIYILTYYFFLKKKFNVNLNATPLSFPT